MTDRYRETLRGLNVGGYVIAAVLWVISFVAAERSALVAAWTGSFASALTWLATVGWLLWLVTSSIAVGHEAIIQAIRDQAIRPTPDARPSAADTAVLPPELQPTASQDHSVRVAGAGSEVRTATTPTHEDVARSLAHLLDQTPPLPAATGGWPKAVELLLWQVGVSDTRLSPDLIAKVNALDPTLVTILGRARVAKI